MNLDVAPPYLRVCLPLDGQELRAVMQAMCAVLARQAGAPVPVPELVITNDFGSERCNGEHLACPGPTNILSFPLSARPKGTGGAGGTDGPGALGSLVLSATVLRRESLFYGQDPSTHTVRLLAHGLAHLFGLEHGPDMWQLCDRLEGAGQKALRRMRAAF